MPIIRQFSQSKVVFDDRYSPLLISTFFGKADVESAQWHDQVHQGAVRQAVDAGLPVVSISDATRAERPGPDVRKFWADNMARTPASIRKALVGTFVVVDSAVLRGVMTAIGWLNEQARSIETFPTLEAAIREGQARLARANVRPLRSLNPTGYQLPRDTTGRAG